MRARLLSALSLALVACLLVATQLQPTAAVRTRQRQTVLDYTLQAEGESSDDQAQIELQAEPTPAAGSQGAWIGSNTTTTPAVAPAPAKPEPAVKPIILSPALEISNANNNATSATPATPASSAAAPAVPAATAATPSKVDPANPGFINELRFDPASRERRNQLRRTVSDSPSKYETTVLNYTATFDFMKSQTSAGYVIDSYRDKTIEELAKLCFNDVRCTGFNSAGDLKSFIRPASKWTVLDPTATPSVNVDPETVGLYYQPQWYRFQPVPCPCGAEVPLNFICSDPNSGDQYLGDPLTDQSCYRAKPKSVTHTCNAATCVKLDWQTKDFAPCPTCGVNITVTRDVKCQSEAGTLFPEKFCKYVSEKPAVSRVCNAPVACEWNKVNGACKAPCGRGYMDINVTCSSPADQSVVPDQFCTAVKPKTVRKCRTKSCIWNTVPDGKCSFSCGEGHRALKATCIEPSKPDVVLPDTQCAGVRRPSVLIKCNNRPCQWDTKPTSPCSQPCGKGQQTVSNTCKDPLSGDIMPAKQCGANPPPSFQYCSVRTCSWETSPFGGCSNSCGSGVQYFNVTCRDPTTGHRVEDTQCKTIAPPAPEAPCVNNACGWHLQPIGECSAPCGTGIQKYNVTCQDPISGKLLPESQCPGTKPSAEATCHVRECHWHRASKGKCSSPCGPGIQAFSLSCRNPEDGSKQKRAQCKNIPVPALSEPCQLHECEWRVKNDGFCDQICGPGRQKRKVSCHDPVSSVRVPTEHCTEKKPSTNTKCYAQACVWATVPTTACSASCGVGTQSVNITCTDPKKRFVLPDSQCFDASKPDTTQSCNLQACRWKTSPASACSTTCGKGTQKLNVVCSDPLANKEQPASQCDEESKPKDTAQCFVKPCSWVSDPPVAKCSEVCGPGHVEVNVTCQDAQAGRIYPDALCAPDAKPVALQPCQLAECRWSANWTDCTKKCGGDFQYSTLTCQHEDGTVVSNTQCKASPPTWKQCATEACTDVPEAFLFYNFDEDVSGPGRALVNRVSKAEKWGLNGLIQGSGSSSVGGRGGKGSAIQLPASSDHTSGPSVVISPGKKLTSPSFSLSFWMQLQATPTKGRFYILVDNRGTQGGGEGFVLYLDPRDGLVYLNDAYLASQGKSHFADSGVPFPNDGQFHHLSVTYNQKLVRFYLDGKQTSVVNPSHAFKFTVAISEHTVYLRGSLDKYWRSLPMAMDEFAYFAYPLSAEQVAILADFESKNVCAAGHYLNGGGCSPYHNVGSALNARCAAGAPYSLEQCLQPLWGLNGCSDMGASYPIKSDLALWNGKAWKEVKQAAKLLAKKDVEPKIAAKSSWGQCKNRTPSGLDHLCDHPPPFHTSVCLQGLFLELGCSRKASGFPASASHPLARQFNDMTWREVKEKMQQIIAGDTKGGLTENMCHDPTPDQDTL